MKTKHNLTLVTKKNIVYSFKDLTIEKVIDTIDEKYIRTDKLKESWYIIMLMPEDKNYRTILIQKGHVSAQILLSAYFKHKTTLNPKSIAIIQKESIEQGIDNLIDWRLFK
jgi:hypothetical protein